MKREIMVWYTLSLKSCERSEPMNKIFLKHQ